MLKESCDRKKSILKKKCFYGKTGARLASILLSPCVKHYQDYFVSSEEIESTLENHNEQRFMQILESVVTGFYRNKSLTPKTDNSPSETIVPEH